jgi:hypothetical protein
VLPLPINALVYTLDGVLVGASDFGYLMKAMIGASAVAASLLVMVEPSGTGLEGVWTALAVLMVGRLATLGWRFQSADGPLPPTQLHLQHQQQLPQHEQQQEEGVDPSGSSSSSSMAAAEVAAPLLLLNNSVEGSSTLRATRRLAQHTSSSSSSSGGGVGSSGSSGVRGTSQRLKKVHNGVNKHGRQPVTTSPKPIAASSMDDSS